MKVQAWSGNQNLSSRVLRALVDPGYKEACSSTLSHGIGHLRTLPRNPRVPSILLVGFRAAGLSPDDQGPAAQGRPAAFFPHPSHLPEHMSGPPSQMLVSASGQWSLEVSLSGNIAFVGVKTLNQQSPDLGGLDTEHLALGTNLSCSATTGSLTRGAGWGGTHTATD